jgi:tetratricopeptide (TPR) repeat protein
VAAQANQLAKVIPILDGWAKGPAGWPEARRWLGRVRAQLGDWEAAWALLSGETNRPSDQDQFLAQVQLRLARVAISHRDPVAATSHLDTALGLAPGLSEAERVKLALHDWLAVEHVRQGQVTAAIAVWEQDFAQRPTDIERLHRLAISTYRQASSFDQARLQPGAAADTLVQADACWRKAIGYWGAVLASPSFWATWTKQRLYGTNQSLSTDDLRELGSTIEEQLTRDLRDNAAQASPSATSSEQAEVARRYAELELLWGLEVAAARLVSDYVREFKLSDWPPDFACGALLLERLNTTLAGQPLVRALRTALPTFRDPSGQRLQNYLGPMGRYYFLIERNRLDQAITELRAVAVWPQAQALLGVALTAKGKEQATTGRAPDALATFAQAKEAGADLSSCADVIADLAVGRIKDLLAVNDDDYVGATNVLDLACKLAGRHPKITAELCATYAQRSRIENNANHFEEAIRFIRLALDYEPTNEQARRFAAIAFANWAVTFVDSNAQRAIDLLRESLTYRRDPDAEKLFASLLFSQVVEHAIAKRRERAISTMREALHYVDDENVPTTVEEAKRRIGNLLFGEATKRVDKSEYMAAADILGEARYYDDDQPTRRLLAIALFREGQRLSEQSNYTAAIARFREALRVEDDSITRRALAFALSQSGGRDEAVQILREALRRDPTNSDVRQQLRVALHNHGVELAEREQVDASITRFKEALQIEDDLGTRQQLALALGLRALKRFQSGNTWGARQDLQEALAYDPNNRNLRDFRARVG